MKKRIIALLMSAVTVFALFSVTACDAEKEKSNDKYLLLVNKQNVLEKDYVPNDLVSIDSAYTTGGKTVQLEETAMNAVIELINGMKKDGITNVTVTSGYRTYARQKELFANYISDETGKHPDWSKEKIKEYVSKYSAPAGASEHQSGLCVDLYTDEMDGLNNYGSETPNNPYDKGFAETEAYEWLCENAYKYGFILRFPENKTDTTGYMYESWHYRYVGSDAAKEIHDRNITLEEYLE